MGKTVGSRELVKLPGALTLIHDDAKAQPEYSAIARYVAGPDELLATPLEQLEQVSVVAFRGDVYAGQECTVDQVATLAVTLARAHLPVRLVVDELDRAVSDGGRKLEAPALREAFVFGRAMGLSVICNVQQPQRMPEIASQASSLGIFNLEAHAVRYISERFSVAPELLELVPTLAQGDFVIHRAGFPWDRTIYRF